jgi:hypothetical protein
LPFFHIFLIKGKYGRKLSWILKIYEKYGRNPSWIMIRFGKYKRKLWNDMGNMEERQVESLFNLPFFHIFPIISQFSSLFSKSFHYSTYLSSTFSISFHI